MKGRTRYMPPTEEIIRQGDAIVAPGRSSMIMGKGNCPAKCDRIILSEGNFPAKCYEMMMDGGNCLCQM